MAHVLRRTYHRPTPDEAVYADDTEPAVADRDYGMTIAERIVWFAASLLLLLLAFRFVFALLGANPANGFANFIYTASEPFVAPFFNLFNYNYVAVAGNSRFEIYTLVAILVYAAVAYIIARLFTIGRRY